jgi:hypothetical protein
MWVLSGDLLALILKLVLGTLAFAWILWTVRNINSRAVGMTLTFPALNGVVLSIEWQLTRRLILWLSRRTYRG